MKKKKKVKVNGIRQQYIHGLVERYGHGDDKYFIGVMRAAWPRYYDTWDCDRGTVKNLKIENTLVILALDLTDIINPKITINNDDIHIAVYLDRPEYYFDDFYTDKFGFVSKEVFNNFMCLKYFCCVKRWKYCTNIFEERTGMMFHTSMPDYTTMEEIDITKKQIKEEAEKFNERMKDLRNHVNKAIHNEKPNKVYEKFCKMFKLDEEE